MIIARYEENMLHSKMFFNVKSHKFHHRTSISAYAIYSIKLIICSFFAILNHLILLHGDIHVFRKFSYRFQLKFAFEK